MDGYSTAFFLASSSAVLMLGGCGTTLPVQDIRYPEPYDFGTLVFHVASQIRCELRQAVTDEVYGSKERAKLRKWAASVALTMRGIDTSRINPTLNAFNALSTFNVFAGGRLEADASREMAMTYFITFEELLADRPYLDSSGRLAVCKPKSPDAIAGNLGIHQTLSSSLDVMDAGTTLSTSFRDGPFDTITHTVKFNVELEGSVGPSWKFANVNFGTGANIYTSSRKQSDELLITMGPAVAEGKARLVPSRALQESFNVERIRSALRPTFNLQP